MKIAFAGLRHGHIYVLFDMAQNNPLFTVTGAFEENEEARKAAQAHGVDCCYESCIHRPNCTSAAEIAALTKEK